MEDEIDGTRVTEMREMRHTDFTRVDLVTGMTCVVMSHHPCYAIHMTRHDMTWHDNTRRDIT